MRKFKVELLIEDLFEPDKSDPDWLPYEKENILLDIKSYLKQDKDLKIIESKVEEL